MILVGDELTKSIPLSFNFRASSLRICFEGRMSLKPKQLSIDICRNSFINIIDNQKNQKGVVIIFFILEERGLLRKSSEKLDIDREIRMSR